MSSTSSEDGIAVVRRFYELAGQNNFEEASKLLAADVVIHETPDVPFGGDYHGLEGNAELMGKITSVLDVAIVSIDILDASDPVVVSIVAHFASKATGEAVDMKVVELLTIRDGKISEIDIYYKNPSAVAALWPN